MKRKFLLPAAALAISALAPAVAPAKEIEIGQTTTPAVPSCPVNCRVVTRTTGFQARTSDGVNPFLVPAPGRIAAFTVSLGKPTNTFTSFFNKTYGGEPKIRLAVLRYNRRLRYKLVAQSSVIKIKRYFGRVVQFPLYKTLPVRRGDVVAISTLTWAPMLSVGLDGDNAWRASRPLVTPPKKGAGCDDFSTQTSQQDLDKQAQYHCYYDTARLVYSATLITTPVPNKK